MAARKLLIHHQDDVRKKIQASVLINRLNDHVAGKVELSATQIQAAKILLDKSVSNAPTVMEGTNSGPLQITITPMQAKL